MFHDHSEHKKKVSFKHDSKNHPSKLTQKVIDQIVVKNVSNTDPNGSYTGKPTSQFEKPVQDADDL